MRAQVIAPIFYSQLSMRTISIIYSRNGKVKGSIIFLYQLAVY